METKASCMFQRGPPEDSVEEPEVLAKAFRMLT